MNHVKIVFLSFGLAGLLLLTLLAGQSPHTVQALPPRPTAVPPHAATELTGGFIALTIEGVADEVWTAVQWQDNDGNWHLVDGWQGTPNTPSGVRWYVGAEDFGSGPFRWLIYDAPQGNQLAASEPFMLPKSARQTVEVEVSLP